MAPKPTRANADSLEAQGKYRECGEAYLAIYQANPDSRQADEVIYNSGVCFDSGGATGLAIMQFRLLSQRFPQSSLAPKALLRTGSLFASLKELARASVAFEEFAKRFPGEKEAPNVLMSAIQNRRSLGHHKEMVNDIESFVKKYKKRHSSDSARLLFVLAMEQEKQGNYPKTIRAYERYLKVFGKTEGPDNALVANVAIGEVLWKQSCRGGTVDGVCSKRVPPPGRKRRHGRATHCGSGRGRLQVVSRDIKLAASAMQYFSAAVALANSGAIDKAPNATRKKTATNSFLASQFFLLERDYEDFLGIRYPKNLRFPVNNRAVSKASVIRFKTWLDAMQATSATLRAKYQNIANVAGTSEWRVASIARIGQLPQHFATVLATAEIPKDVRVGTYALDAVNAFCDELAAQAKPMEALATAAYEQCITVPSTTPESKLWNTLCQRELAGLNRRKVP